MTKADLARRLKKLKNEKGFSYETVSNNLGYTSPMTSYKWINNKKIPKRQYAMLDQYLTGKGY